jgi:protocatechuate 3,4-dioxygenase beta subunit
VIPSQSGDLTQVAGRPGRAQGQVLHVIGRVLSRTGEPARGVTLFVWQARTPIPVSGFL